MKSEHLGEFEELVLLCVCTLGSEATGASIQTALGEQAGRAASLGSIYAALDRMARKGAVESWLGEPLPERGGRARRYYRATREGRVALSDLHHVRARLWKRAGLAPRRG
jgi:DNA-binding PadR family transcriptional regulator